MTSIEPTTPATPATPATTGDSPAKKKGAARFITPVLVLVAVLGLGIFGGVLIGQNTGSSSAQAGGAPSFDGASGDMPTGGGAGGGGGMGALTSGTVVSVDGDTITLETSDGEQITVTTSDDTTVTTTEESDVASLAAGDELTVTGEADDAGDVTATSISEGATMFGGFGGQAPSSNE